MTPARPSVLLYDWDNTLADGWAGISGALNATFDAFGMPSWTIEDTKNRVRVALRESFPKMFGDRWEEARDIFYDAFQRRHLEFVRPMDGAAEALAAAGAIPQGIVSNKAGPYLRAEVVHFGWSGFFGPVIGAGDATADKPDPAPIFMALSQMGKTADKSVWYLGDTALDMVAAKAAGVTAVLVGDAAHDGGVANAAPDIHFPSAYHVADLLRLHSGSGTF